MTSQVTFIGAGNMASAIFGGMIEGGYPAAAITATGRDPQSLDALASRYGIQTTSDNDVAVEHADVVVLAVKPQVMREVCHELRDSVQRQRPLIVSVAAGLSAETLDNWLGGNMAVIRCMPNTPSLVGQGAAGLYANARVSEEQKRLATSLLETVGLVEWVADEHLLEAVTAVSGSGPAYFFLIMEALEDAGKKLGLPADSARRLALQTAYGAASMARESEFEPAELRRRVTSPNGTTERAINSFEDDGLRQLFEHATQACATRARELADELSRD
ncbi:pyrroline-5-carboxylate reductase [Chromohalobacter marismortui]|uniref:Pyrroline-5-carboxylate reductase n=1 Tax=Chromohalobacter marismortui TaxID=42055 RepID=A0A4R7NEJ9_9GAMM|nr:MULTISPECIES: pyrroline-5-carboxylate reductase [Chromohalobacter]MCI0510096.1 pyrroline-5-carboxylate reductase [Chromohalobacter sp.]MCI0593727.1 pyrroline-5-carboxylate reductase [Chromohalobacter sp.]TDU18935.1 pyrroline-5-carboxylate reductase [Chromohalobacter marismortui]